MVIHGLYVRLTQQQPKALQWEGLERTIPVPNLLTRCPLLETRADCAGKTRLKQVSTRDWPAVKKQSNFPQVDKQLSKSDEPERNQNPWFGIRGRDVYVTIKTHHSDSV